MELLTQPKSAGNRATPTIEISPAPRSAKTPTRKYASPVGHRKVLSRGKNTMASSNELDQELDFLSELTGKKELKPKEVDIDSCDLETLLGEYPNSRNVTCFRSFLVHNSDPWKSVISLFPWWFDEPFLSARFHLIF